jgi:hypothetical protein
MTMGPTENSNMITVRVLDAQKQTILEFHVREKRTTYKVLPDLSLGDTVEIVVDNSSGIPPGRHYLSMMWSE